MVKIQNSSRHFGMAQNIVIKALARSGLKCGCQIVHNIVTFLNLSGSTILVKLFGKKYRNRAK